MTNLARHWRRAALVAAFVVPFVLAAPAAAKGDDHVVVPEQLIANATAFQAAVVANVTERFGLPAS
jgi:hypothetical protein